MRLTGTHSRRELIITLAIWGVLLLCAVIGLFTLRSQATGIINRIHYVDVSRGEKAAVLYAEAEKNALKVFEEFDKLNAGAQEKVPVPATNPHLQRSLELYDEATVVDPYPEFAPERKNSYEVLAQLYEVAGRRADELLTHARSFLVLNNQESARDYIQQALAVAPHSPEPLVLLAQANLQANNLEGASIALNEVYTSSTITPKARFVKGQLLLRQGKSVEAAEELRLAFEEDPDNLDIRSRLADTLNNLDKTQEAAKIMQDGLAKGGWYDGAYMHRYGEMLVKLKDLDEAIRVLEQADKLEPHSGNVQFSLARAYHRAGKPRQAASALRRAVEVNPDLQKQVLE